MVQGKVFVTGKHQTIIYQIFMNQIFFTEINPWADFVALVTLGHLNLLRMDSIELLFLPIDAIFKT